MDVGWWALIVSALGLGLGVLNFLRNSPLKPKWDMAVKVDTHEDGERYITASAANRGRGIARDVSLEPASSGLMSDLARQRRETVEFGKTLVIGITHGPEAEGDGAFLLTWSEEPRLHKRRTKRVSYHLDSLL